MFINKQIRQEYADGVPTLEAALRQHISYCVLYDFDQIQDTDLIQVSCCNCDNSMKLKYDSLALVLFCKDCKDTTVTNEHLSKLHARLAEIQKKLITL